MREEVKVMLEYILSHKEILIGFVGFAILFSIAIILPALSRRDVTKNQKDKSIENPEREVRVK